jgi:hypothetical protein
VPIHTKPDSDTLLLIHSNTTEGSTEFVDASPYNRTITRVGSTAVHKGVDGALGSSVMFFDGNASYLSMPDSSDFYFDTSDFTIEARIYPIGNGAGDIWSQHIGSSNGNPRIMLQINPNESLYVYDYSGGTGFTTSASAITLDEWNHVALVRQGTVAKIFVNGTQVDSNFTSDSTWSNNSNPAYIGYGRTSMGNAHYFKGYMEEVRISNSARWTSNFTPPTEQYTSDSNTKLLIQSSSVTMDETFVDNSPSKHLITSHGNVTHFSPKFGATSMYFDGYQSGGYLQIAATTDIVHTGDFTLECWIKKNSSANPAQEEYIISSMGSTAGFYIYHQTDGTFYFGHRASSSEKYIGFVMGSGVDTAWHHLALVRAGGYLRFYYDGISQPRSYDNYSHAGDIALGSGTETIKIGSKGSDREFDGYIDEVRISTTARWSSNFIPPNKPYAVMGNTFVKNVDHLRNQTETGGTIPGLIAWYKDGSEVDSGPNGFHGDSTNVTHRLTTGPWKGGSLPVTTYADSGSYTLIPTMGTVIIGKNPRTISAWVMPNATLDSSNYIFGFGNCVSSGKATFNGRCNDRKMSFMGCGEDHDGYGDVVYTQDSWVRIWYTYDGATLGAYYTTDGVIKTSWTWSVSTLYTKVDGPAIAVIGGHAHDYPHTLNANSDIRDFRIYNKVLTREEMGAMWDE